MEEILEATPTGLLDEAKEVIDAVVSLPSLSVEFEALAEQISSIQNTVSGLVIFDFILLIAVVVLFYRSFKKWGDYMNKEAIWKAVKFGILF